MDQVIEILSDASESDQTVIIENHLIGKYIEQKPACSSTKSKNIYNLDEFSDDEPASDATTEPRKNVEASTNRFSFDNFCEDSSNMDFISNKISQIERTAEYEPPPVVISEELQRLLNANTVQFACENVNSSSEDQHKAREDNKDLSDDSLLSGSSKRRKLKAKSSDRMDKDLARAAKAMEREKKKQEKEEQKQLKNALKVVENCMKPDKCLQYVTVKIDENIMGKAYGEVIKAGLKSAGYNNLVTEQIVPNVISWTRNVPSIENNVLQQRSTEEENYLLIMDLSEFIHHIADDTLTAHLQSLLTLPQIHHLSIAVMELQEYYRLSKNQQKTANKFGTLPRVSKEEIEQKLIELQFYCKNIYIRFLDKFEDLAVFVGECTKSVAQKPYKLTKHQSSQGESQLFSVNNRDCVKIDKDGNGLSRLWSQCLRLFPMANLETSEAIIAVYPTMNSLIKAYKHCKDTEEGEKLLQNVPVRRGAGPLGGQRRLGPELSKKIYRFFCSQSNVVL